jgi:hypothetical protein
MCVVGGHWEIIGCVGGFFKLSPLEISKSLDASSGVFDISSTIWSTISPILDYGVARIGPATSIYAPIDYLRVDASREI